MNITTKIKKLARFMDSLKRSKRALVVLIFFNIFLAIGSNIADFHLLRIIKPHLLPLTFICSLYPLTLAIWLTIYYYRKRVAPWFTAFIFVGLVAYGLMAQIYYPLFISWDGFNWILVGNMFWVAMYGIQSLTIASELRPLKIWQYVPVFGYFFLKDYSDRFWGTFTDIVNFPFPAYAPNLLLALILVFQIFAMITAVVVAKRNVI